MCVFTAGYIFLPAHIPWFPPLIFGGKNMKKATLIATTLICAYLIVAGIASAQTQKVDSKGVPVERTPVAGFSPNFADPQPATSAKLTKDANRLIRWQGWLDVDAFSASILEQMQKQVANGSIGVGKFTLDEPSINRAVVKAQKDPDILNFKPNDNLEKGKGENFKGDVALYVWIYRHNFADMGLYQLYISAKGKMEIGTGQKIEIIPPPPVKYIDIQDPNYENPAEENGVVIERITSFAIERDIEIWRSVVVRVNARGVLELIGNEASVDEPGKVQISDLERAPSLEGNKNYNPRGASGAEYVEPLERAEAIHENDVQKATGSVPKPDGDLRKDGQEQGRVNTVPRGNFRYRNR